jgi:hypothetical protein
MRRMPYCRGDCENRCHALLFTGSTRDGGYATHALTDGRFCFPLGEEGDDAEIAPWRCAGLIGLRSYRLAGDGTPLGLHGFGTGSRRPHPCNPVRTRLAWIVKRNQQRSDICLCTYIPRGDSLKTCAPRQMTRIAS